jgi:hypothetical protein
MDQRKIMQMEMNQRRRELASQNIKETVMAHQELKASDTTVDKPVLNIEKTGKPAEQAPAGPHNLPPGHPDSPGHPSKQQPKQ